MTVREIRNAWRRALEDNRIALVPLPVTQEYDDTPVIFPDGSPVRSVYVGFMGGQMCLVLSGETP